MSEPWTPGPWEATQPGLTDGTAAYWWEVVHPIRDGWDYYSIAEVSNAKGAQEANARLIAAAPEMADALQTLMELAGPCSDDIHREVWCSEHRMKRCTGDADIAAARALLDRIRGEA